MTYYYHSDHLGSAQLITDYKGEEYERLEYTPYGELWIDKTPAISILGVPYRFTGKERDSETGLYYVGARYLDPKISKWLSTDPAMGEYVPSAGNRNNRLPNGGLYNHLNFHVYNYSNNNPVTYTDPDGNSPIIPALIGIAMLPKKGDGFLYFNTNQPQYLGGYNNKWENFTSNNRVCNIDSLRTDFKRANGKNASIWLWKGDYNMTFNGGWHTGAEIGAYNNFGFGDDSILKSASFSLKDSNGNVMTSRSLEGKHWVNSFVKGNGTGKTNGANGNPSSMWMSATLEFNDAADAESYHDALVNGGTRNNTFLPSINRSGSNRDTNDYTIRNPSINGNTVTFDYQ